MAISGLVVTLSTDEDLAADARERIAADPRLTPGECFGHRLAVVAETPGVEEDRRLWDELRAWRGVVHVDVAFVHLDEPLERTEGPLKAEENRDAHH